MSYFSPGKLGLFRDLCLAYARKHNIVMQPRQFKASLFDHVNSKGNSQGSTPDIDQASFVHTKSFLTFAMNTLFQSHKQQFMAIGYPNVSFFHYLIKANKFSLFSLAVMCEEIDTSGKLEKRQFCSTGLRV